MDVKKLQAAAELLDDILKARAMPLSQQDASASHAFCADVARYTGCIYLGPPWWHQYQQYCPAVDNMLAGLAPSMTSQVSGNCTTHSSTEVEAHLVGRLSSLVVQVAVLRILSGVDVLTFNLTKLMAQLGAHGPPCTACVPQLQRPRSALWRRHF